LRSQPISGIEINRKGIAHSDNCSLNVINKRYHLRIRGEKK
jgi:hypothetical protein